jgi:ATP-dependent protease ClpP protease subunit
MNIMCKRKSKVKCDDDEASSDEDDVTRVDNNIYFYSDVSRKSILKLTTLLKEATQDILKQMLGIGGTGNIYLHICSDGGATFEGLGGMDIVKSNKVPVTTVIEVLVCSEATFIALGGATVTMRPSSHVLIHQLTSSFWGNYEEFNDEKETLDKMMNTLRAMYEKHTSIPQNVLDSMFKRDIYMNCDECMKWGVVQSVFE